MTASPTAHSTSASPDPLERAVLSKVSRRLGPLLFLLYAVAYVDRTNVSFAALQMNRDLGFSGTVYGTGAGIFFLGYGLFELPSNLILARVGARRWIARIAVTWGLCAMATMLVRGSASFFALRALLGVAEAGLFPGIVFYLAHWFPAPQRARAVASFMLAIPISGIASGLLASALLRLNGVMGLAGWQWLFLVEGIPAVALGVIAWRHLTDGPEHADWLSATERSWLVARLRAEHEAADAQLTRRPNRARQALADPDVWNLALVYLFLGASGTAYALWSPQMLQELTGLRDTQIGVVAALISAISGVAMWLNGAHSDRTGERRLHVAVPIATAAFAWLVSAWTRVPALGVLALVVVSASQLSIHGPFWVAPTVFLRGNAAAAGIAVINSLAIVSGILAPAVLGAVKDATGGFRATFVGLALLSGVSALLALRMRTVSARSLEGPVPDAPGAAPRAPGAA